MSFLYQRLTNVDSDNDDFFQWGFSSDNPETSIMIRNNRFSARSVPSGSNTAASSINEDLSSLPGPVYFLVFKATKSVATTYDRVSLFVNPTSATEPTPDITATTDSGTTSITDFIVRTAFHEVGDAWLMDNLEIATTYAEVIPLAPLPSE
jgi:hypothetical protein